MNLLKYQNHLCYLSLQLLPLSDQAYFLGNCVCVCLYVWLLLSLPSGPHPLLFLSISSVSLDQATREH